MAPTGHATLFFCIVFITCCCTVTEAQIPIDCCLSVSNKSVQRHLVADYQRQVKGHGCSINATILLTRRGKKLCVPVDEPWIQEVVKHVDALKKHCKKHHKSNRCNGVKV